MGWMGDAFGELKDKVTLKEMRERRKIMASIPKPNYQQQKPIDMPEPPSYEPHPTQQPQPAKLAQNYQEQAKHVKPVYVSQQQQAQQEQEYEEPQQQEREEVTMEQVILDMHHQIMELRKDVNALYGFLLRR